jgi:uncharacterized protein (TIGR03067 family)
MKRFGITAVLVAALVAAGTVGAGDAAKEELKRLQGTWKVLKMQQDGKPAPAEMVEKTQVVFTGDKVTVTISGERDEVATITVDPSKNPATVDICPEKEKGVIKGIYKLVKNQLTVCFAKDPKRPRPKEFSSTEEAGTGLIVLERVKK